MTFVDVGDGVALRLRQGGEGPAVILLHGHPRTHTTWHRVAPLLAQDFTVVCPDLRGYGQSSKPPPDSAHHAYSDRTMARDIVRLMEELGHERFALVGHDRGSYVAYRAALDHPEHVTHLAVLDGVPIVEALERADAAFAQSWWHWFFFASPHAHRVITADPLAWYQPDRDRMGQENYDDMVAAVSDPDTVLAMLEDYRASLHVDRAVDEADRASGRRIRCPTLVAWSAHDDLEDLYGDPTLIWARWCSGPLSGAVIGSGHHMAEEAPGQLATTLTDFLHA
ncbi:alpha/beta fold hydrolase [Ornithinimicrobium sufpigmenti]|uniref:alpha/beta fold hydrolase n=1 Tax=Ornithinimicrobium sufpigmenti TaxID=2508882 RepID=UPI001036CD4B|nr:MULTISPECIES: alpha/beta hydrolase [unclassified Ornithinimicrobium]